MPSTKLQSGAFPVIMWVAHCVTMDFRTGDSVKMSRAEVWAAELSAVTRIEDNSKAPSSR